MRKSTGFFLLCVAFIVGIAFHSLISPDKRIFETFFWYTGFLVSAAAGVMLWSSPDARIGTPARAFARYVSFFFAFVFLGLFRYAQIIPVVDKDHISFYTGREITVQGTVDSLPKVREKTVAYVIKVTSLRGRASARGNLVSALLADRDRHASLSSARDDIDVEGKLLLTADRLPQYGYGDLLAFTCAPTKLNEYEQSARKDGVSASCAFPRPITHVSPHNPSQPRRAFWGGVRFKMALYHLRERVHLRLTSLFPEPYGGLLAGILYGDTSGVSSSLKESFRVSGLAHITALSGYNISIMSGVLMDVLIFFWLTRMRALPVSLLMIAGFVLATGAEASVVRAAIMGSLVAIAKGVGRLAKMQNALVGAAAVMLAISPHLLRFDLGFALSFLSTIALLVFSEPIAKRSILRYLPKTLGIRDAAASSAAALFITLPLILYVIGKIGPFSLLVNILVVPVLPFAMGFGAAAVAVDFIARPAALPIVWATRLLLGYIISVAEYFSGFGAFQIRLNAFLAVILFLGLVGGLWIWTRRNEGSPKKPQLPRATAPAIARIGETYEKWRAFGRALYRAVVPLAWRKYSVWIALGIVAALILTGQFFLRREPPLTVYFYDLGQGDGYLIRTRQGFDVLVDGGPTDKIVEKLGRTLPFWDKTIELMILTHPHADHVTGLIAVLKRFKVERVLTTGVLHTTDEYLAWLEEIKKQNIPIITPKDVARGIILSKSTECSAAPCVPLSGGQAPALHERDLSVLEILWPEEDFEGKRVKEEKIGEGGGLNDTSIVAKLVYGQTSFLLMGDATTQTEELLLETYGDELKADVLKVGHHGSKYSSSREFLEVVNPDYAIIQVGQNRYGHPAYPTLWRLARSGAAVLRNDKDGDVVFESDGITVKIR